MTRHSARRGGCAGKARGTVSMLWLNTSGRASSTISSAPSLRRKSGVSTSMLASGRASRIAWMVAAKCAAPPSSRSSRSTDVTTTCDKRERRNRVGDACRLARVDRPRLASAHIAEGARPGAGVAEDHEGRMALLPALADIRARGLFADGGEASLPQDAARILEAWRGGCPHPDPGRLRQDGRVGQPRLLGMARPRRQRSTHR